MEYKYKISNYSDNPHEIVMSWSENISNISDRLIRIAAKCTEHYAGDVIYDIRALQDAVDTKFGHDRVLFFREGGVSMRIVNSQDALVTTDFLPACIQAWRLTHDPATTTTTLRRVELVYHGEYTHHYIGCPT